MMREAGNICAQILHVLTEHVKPGATSQHINDIAYDLRKWVPRLGDAGGRWDRDGATAPSSGLRYRRRFVAVLDPSALDSGPLLLVTG
jgi:hypothetical protein